MPALTDTFETEYSRVAPNVEPHIQYLSIQLEYRAYFT
jgi:hypothetical protein